MNLADPSGKLDAARCAQPEPVTAIPRWRLWPCRAVSAAFAELPSRCPHQTITAELGTRTGVDPPVLTTTQSMYIPGGPRLSAGAVTLSVRLSPLLTLTVKGSSARSSLPLQARLGGQLIWRSGRTLDWVGRDRYIRLRSDFVLFARPCWPRGSPPANSRVRSALGLD